MLKHRKVAREGEPRLVGVPATTSINLSGMLAFSTPFSGDMSGAKVTGARFDGSTFLAGTTCPNGKVLAKTGGPNACGL